jgi:hypothetical protein
MRQSLRTWLLPAVQQALGHGVHTQQAASAALQASGSAAPSGAPTRRWSLYALAGAAAASGMVISSADSADSQAPPPARRRGWPNDRESRRRVFFKYEKRVREFSTLEKIFEYFSTAREEDGTQAMNARDLVRSIVPTYPPHNSQMERGGYLDGACASRQHPGSTPARSAAPAGVGRAAAAADDLSKIP